jgi:beta-lactam-binding protein with PASTA domain/Ca2+-binding RTX toxin-like protein
MVLSSLTPGGSPVVVRAQAPVGAGFALNAGDLRFIFRQIEIAQAHAAGGELLGPGPNQVSEPRLPFGLRTVDGSFNHLSTGHTKYGAADQIFPRLGPRTHKEAENWTIDPDGPGPIQIGDSTSYTQKRGLVNDSQPRIISNLIADQTVRNPAAVAAAGPGAVPEPLGTLPIPDVAPDEGLSAPFNSMFTFFGQFFDHGLDLVTKGGGTVFVPLQPDDPLYVEGSQTNFMVLTRATNRDCTPGPGCVQDGVGDNPATPEDESANDVQEATNTTTPFVDQNQTYTSHPSHQVFLREYRLVNNRPVATGRLIDGAIPGNIGNWGEVKEQALTMLGIRLEDSDVFNVPLLQTDPYGRFLRGPNGFPLMVMQSGPPQEGNPLNPIGTAGAMLTGHAFLDDIAHNAAPASGLAPDANDTIGSIFAPQAPGTYDDELLDAHFITGDGRGNENIALTAVHAVFHLEHNRLAVQIGGANGISGGLIDTLLTPAEAAAWRAVDGPSGWDYGERVFQAARFVTEMQYQHLVFEEFARKLAPSINAFVGDGINFRSDTNPAIMAEFAHAVYRLGHSMLTETIARTRPNGSTYDIPLLEGFLNPLEFNHDGNGGTLSAPQAAGAIFQGGTRQVGNMIDEFVTEAVRNRLLGLPLDLAVLNIARGRSEGLPSLNALRREIYLATNDSAMVPYGSWFDFAFALKHAETLENFIAAYGIHPSLEAAATVEDKRAAAAALAFDGDFMFGDAAVTGLENVDLWIGGLAEQIAPFGGMLGSTFNYVFEHQLESLQDADRFYYLERLDGLNLLSQLEGNSFAELVQRNTALTGAGADIFGRPDLVLNLANIAGPNNTIADDPTTPDIDERTIEGLSRLPNGTFRYAGDLHVIINGSDTAGDRAIASIGDDTMRGNGGNDRFESGAGNDQPIGGAGDDILTDVFGDDVMKGGPGNDAISGGAGLDLLQGNEGNDFIVAGNDESENFGGPGNDVIYMGAGLSESIGGAGDDWMEGTLAPASILIGDDNNQFQDDPNGGHDIGLAGPGDLDFDMEGGDDIMVGTVLPTHRFEGMLGFDWATYRGETIAVDADMLITGAVAANAPLNELRDRFDNTEGLSGTNFDDLLRGDDRANADLVNDPLTGVANGHVLTQAGIARITGLSTILPAGATTWAEGNIILGGSGNDLLEGRGGDDILDGDRWLNVQLRGVLNGGQIVLADRMAQLRDHVFADPQRLNPGNITYVRSIVVGAPGVDTAVFTGNQAEYLISGQAPGPVTVDHQGGVDGVDTLRNIEFMQFADGTIPVPGAAIISVPTVVNALQANAVSSIQNAGLVVGAITTASSTTVAAGRVISQSPTGGSPAVAGMVVSLVVSSGAPNVTVPNVVGALQAAAQTTITGAGLSVGTIGQASSSTVAAGRVMSQTPQGGASVPANTAVNLVVSTGPSTAVVPNVVGVPQADAQASIVAAGLTVGGVTQAFGPLAIPVGSVISSNPAGGTTVNLGSSVALSVQAATAAVTFPSNGAENVDLSQSITWTPVPGADAYILHIGTAPGTFDVLAAGLLTNTSYLVTTPVPASPTVLHVRVFARVAGVWRAGGTVSFTAAPPVTLTTTLTFPVSGAENVDLSQNLTWTPVAGADAYILHIGTAPSTFDVLAAGLLTQPSYRVTTSVPTAPTLLYARVFTRVSGVWRAGATTTFTAAPLTTALTFPAPGAQNVDLTQDLTWAPVPGADAYILHIGTTPGAFDVLAAGLLTQTSYRVTGAVPSDPTILHARVLTRVGGVWRAGPITSFTALPQVPLFATLTSPVDGSVVVAPHDFTWTSVAGADAYILHIGTQPGTFDVLAAGLLTQPTFRVTAALPTNQPLYARVFSRVQGVWRSSATVQFTAAAQ